MFGWLFARKEPPRTQAEEQDRPGVTQSERPPAVYLATSNGDFRDIVYQSGFQEALARICGDRTDKFAEVDVNAVLRLERGSSPDAKAVAVVIERHKVGHLSFRDALVMEQFLHMQKASEAHCLGEIDRGCEPRAGGEVYFNVKLDIAWPPLRD